MHNQLIYFLDNLHVGGAERHTIDLSRALEEKGFDARYLVYGQEVSAAIADSSVLDRSNVLNARRLLSLSAWLAAARALRAARPDLIIAVNQTSAIISAIVTTFFGLPIPILLILHADVSHITSARDRRILPIFLFCARAAKVVVFVSDRQKDAWAREGLRPRKEAVIHNGVDLQKYGTSISSESRERAKRAVGFSDGDTVFGLVARFRPEKNHDGLIDALAVVRKHQPSAKVLFVGDGPTRPAIEAKVRSLRLSEHVMFVGEQSEVRSYVEAMDVGVMCSTAETFPLAALEIMAGGIPMILADVGGASEMVIDGRTGLLCRAGDGNDLANKMLLLFEPNARDEMGSAARAFVHGQFGQETMTDRYATLMSRLIGERDISRST